jgi:hypothetical protein
MDDPLATIYENNMLRGIGAALTLATSPLAVKDSPQDYRTAASQIANYIKTFDSQINLTNDANKKNNLLKQKENEISRLKFIINKLHEMGVSDDEIRKLNK